MNQQVYLKRNKYTVQSHYTLGLLTYFYFNQNVTLKNNYYYNRKEISCKNSTFLCRLLTNIVSGRKKGDICNHSTELC